MEEQFRPKETVGGSTPSRGTKFSMGAFAEECLLGTGIF